MSIWARRRKRRRRRWWATHEVMAFTVRSQFSTAGCSPVGTEDSDSPAPRLTSARWQWCSTCGGGPRPPLPLQVSKSHTWHRGTWRQPTEATTEVLTTKMIVSIWPCRWGCPLLAGRKSRLTISKRVCAFVAQNSFDYHPSWQQSVPGGLTLM